MIYYHKLRCISCVIKKLFIPLLREFLAKNLAKATNNEVWHHINTFKEGTEKVKSLHICIKTAP